MKIFFTASKTVLPLANSHLPRPPLPYATINLLSDRLTYSGQFREIMYYVAFWDQFLPFSVKFSKSSLHQSLVPFSGPVAARCGNTCTSVIFSVIHRRLVALTSAVGLGLP